MQYTTYEIEICWQVTIIVRYNQFEETKQVGMILGLRKSKNSYTRIKQDYCISRVISKTANGHRSIPIQRKGNPL